MGKFFTQTPQYLPIFWVRKVRSYPSILKISVIEVSLFSLFSHVLFILFYFLFNVFPLFLFCLFLQPNEDSLHNWCESQFSHLKNSQMKHECSFLKYFLLFFCNSWHFRLKDHIITPSCAWRLKLCLPIYKNGTLSYSQDSDFMHWTCNRCVCSGDWVTTQWDYTSIILCEDFINYSIVGL